jgi:hypothetical protein
MIDPDGSTLPTETGDTEPVTFTSTRTDGDVSATVSAWVYVMSVREAVASRGVYESGDAQILIAQTDLEALGGAKPADVVTLTDGSAYTVLTAQALKFNGPWSLTARNLILANDLLQTGTLSRPTNAQDPAGRPTLANYTAIAANVPCRVQPEGGTATDVAGRRTIPARFTAYLGQQVDARAKDQFVCDGLTYTVLEVRNPQRITDLQSLVLEQVL